MSGLSAEQRKVLGSMTSDQIAEFKQFGDRVSRDATLVSAISDDARQARELGSRLATTASRAQQAQASYGERSALAERVSEARERGESIAIDIAQDPYNLAMFLRYAERYGGDSAAAATLLDAELARQGLRPSRSFSDGTALPASFQDLREQWSASAADPALNPDLAARNAQNRGAVARALGSDPPTTPEQPRSSIRPEVGLGRAAIREQTDRSRRGFDAETEVSRSADGTVSTKKSLLLQSGRQVAADTGATLDEAKDAVKGVLKK